MTCWIQHHGFPPILYTDEDKLIGSHAVQPYLKPDFDPVLLLNSAYIAHLGVIDRKLALDTALTPIKSTEGSPDWDLFTRFFVAGKPAIHIPEVVYSWRMHPESTADDAGSKPYIHSSQKAVLQRYLDSSGVAEKFDVEYSPLLKNSCDWRLHRKPVNPHPSVQLAPRPQATIKELADLVSTKVQTEEELVCLVADDLVIDRADWLWEAIGLFERFPDTAMVGARIRDKTGSVLSGGLVLGFGCGCDCPDRGRPALDPGHFTQMMKQRSVSAVSSQFAVLPASVLYEMAKQEPASSVAMLGPWLGAWALRNGKRVIYSPYLAAVASIDWEALQTPAQIADFKTKNADLMPDHRFYPRAFGLSPEKAYRLTD